MQLDPPLTRHHIRVLPSSVKLKLSRSLILSILFICLLMRQDNALLICRFCKAKCDFILFFLNQMRNIISKLSA